jgi:DNA-binding SARP family transcriptional activator
MLRARLLGQCEVHLDNQLIKVPSRPTQSILAYLLLHPNTAHRREKLAGLCWASSSESNARSNLRHSLWLIRKAFGAAIDPRLEADDLEVTYRPQPGDQLDVETLERSPEDEGSTDALLAAVSAYQGELLPGFYEEWVVLERERLQAAYERKMEALLDHLLAEERWQEVLEWGEHWISSGSTPEPAYRALMLAQAGLGNPPAAAATYQRCTEALSRELGLEPSEVTRTALEQIRNGHVEPALPRRARPAPIIPTLPAYLDEPEKAKPVFVQRDSQLATLNTHLLAALKEQAHVLFVRGEAGSGKSALLQEFMRRSLTAHPDLVVGWGTCNAFFGQGVPYLPFRDVMNMLAGDLESLYANGAITRSQASRLIGSFPWVIQSLLEHGPGLLTGLLNGSALAARTSLILPGKTTWRQRMVTLDLQETPAAGTQENAQLLELYAEVLRSIASHHPVMILLDDLQWMDPGTGRLLFHLVRRLQSGRGGSGPRGGAAPTGAASE